MNLKNTITQAMARVMLAMSGPSADLEQYIYRTKPVHTRLTIRALAVLRSANGRLNVDVTVLETSVSQSNRTVKQVNSYE